MANIVNRISPQNIEMSPKDFLASKYKKYDRSQLLFGILLENYSNYDTKSLYISNNPEPKPNFVKPFTSQFAFVEEFRYRENLKGSIFWRLSGVDIHASYEIPYRR